MTSGIRLRQVSCQMVGYNLQTSQARVFRTHKFSIFQILCIFKIIKSESEVKPKVHRFMLIECYSIYKKR